MPKKKIKKRLSVSLHKLPVSIQKKKQYGKPKSRSLDKKRKALPAGARISRTGKIYIETRANRSDKNLRKRI